MSTTRKALAFSYLDRYASLVVFIVTSMIIARLLTPAQVGVFSITMVMIGFVAPFRDLGASQYLIHEKELTDDRIRSVWAVQLGLSLVLAPLIFTLRDVVAGFYREPQISDIMVVLSVHALLIPFSALTNAWLTRELRFDQLAVIRFSGTVIGSASSVYLAWQGFGAISLAWGALLTNLVSALVAVLYRPRHFPWLPGFKEVRRVVGFGSAISGITLMNLAYHSVAELLLGRLQGMHATGLYGRAQGLVLLFERLVMDSVHSVALAGFSKLTKENQPLDGAFIHGEGLISVLGWSLLGYLAIMAFPMINLLYGDQWNDAVDLARYLCVGMCFMLLTALCPALLIAAGHRWVSLLLSLVNVAIQTGFALVGAYIGLDALGPALLAASCILTLIWLAVSTRLVGISRRDFLASQWLSLKVVAFALVGPMLVLAIFGVRPEGIVLPILFSGLGAAAGFLGAVRYLNHPVWIEIRHILDGLGSWLRKAD